MNFVKMIIGLPLLIIIAVFAFVNNDMATFSLWPFNIDITTSLSVAVIFLLIFGYVVGKFDSWISYAPLRKALRTQRRQNKKLSQQQQELAGKVETLKGDLETAKIKVEPVSDSATEPKPQLKEKFKNLFKRKPTPEKPASKANDFWCL